ncbi:MAG: hypothetical protein JNM90_10435 [Burkholderiales bacterium]|nr:hypothetical protein [Burkholderiales bacterium]
MAHDDSLFKTTRMALLRGASPAYLPGQSVFLQRDVQGFAKGTEGKIVTVQATRPGEHRYQLLVGADKIWAFESDVRPTAPGESPLVTGKGGDLSITQRLQTMSLSQRMATLGVDETRRLNDLASTRRMHTLTAAERMKELLKTNRLSNVAPGDEADAPAGPGSEGGTTPPDGGRDA